MALASYHPIHMKVAITSDINPPTALTAMIQAGSFKISYIGPSVAYEYTWPPELSVLAAPPALPPGAKSEPASSPHPLACCTKICFVDA